MDKTQQSGGTEARSSAKGGNGGAVAPAPPSRSPRAAAGSGGGGGARRDGGDGGGSGTSPSAGAEVSDAIGHHQVRDIKRGEGQSAVKSAAYITGESIFDGRVGLTFGRATGAGRVLDSGTVGPKGTAWTASQLWSAAETAETRKNSRVAQEHIVALPAELDAAAHKRLLNGYALHLRDRYGVAATWALHAPSPHGDQRNVHGHILTTTRRAAAGADGSPVLGEKVRALSGDRNTVAATIEAQRAEWAKRVNGELERAGASRRMDHRSHARRAEQGKVPKVPGEHNGARKTAIERRKKTANEGKYFDPPPDLEALEDDEARGGRGGGGGGGGMSSVQRLLAQQQRDEEREAAAAARWQAKQARQWEQWRRQQEAAAAKEAGRNDDEPR